MLTKHPNTFKCSSMLVMGWIDMGVGTLCELFGQVYYVGSHRMINILFLDFFRGGGFKRPLKMPLYLAEALRLMYWAQEPPWIDETMIFSLASMELGQLGLLV